MKTTITTSGEFVRAVEVQEIAAVPGSYRVQFSSRLSSARNPETWQNNFCLFLQSHELEALHSAVGSFL